MKKGTVEVVDIQNFGPLVRSVRKSMGLTLEDMAAKTGYSVPKLSCFERGESFHSDLFARVEEALGVSITVAVAGNRADMVRMFHMEDYNQLEGK